MDLCIPYAIVFLYFRLFITLHTSTNQSDGINRTEKLPHAAGMTALTPLFDYQQSGIRSESTDEPVFCASCAAYLARLYR